MGKKNRSRKKGFAVSLAMLMIFGLSFSVYAAERSNVKVTTTVTPTPGGMNLNFDAFTVSGSIGETAVAATNYTKNGTPVTKPEYTTQVGSGTGYSVYISGTNFDDGSGNQLNIERLKATVKDEKGNEIGFSNVPVPPAGSGSGAKIDEKITDTNITRGVSFAMDLSKDQGKYKDTNTLSHISKSTKFKSKLTFSYTEAY